MSCNAGVTLQTVALEDMNGDQRPDLVITSPGLFHIYLNNGGGFDLTPQVWRFDGTVFREGSRIEWPAVDENELFLSRMANEGWQGGFDRDSAVWYPERISRITAVMQDLVDVNGDGFPDLVRVRSGVAEDGTPEVGLWFDPTREDRRLPQYSPNWLVSLSNGQDTFSDAEEWSFEGAIREIRNYPLLLI